MGILCRDFQPPLVFEPPCGAQKPRGWVRGNRIVLFGKRNEQTAMDSRIDGVVALMSCNQGGKGETASIRSLKMAAV